MANTLYIIGNGFDRYHQLETRYASFALFGKNRYSDMYDLFIEYFALPDLDENDPNSLNDQLWADFESALADLDFETVLDDNSDYAANPGSENFRDRDWHVYEIEMKGIVKKLTTEMRKAFREFILAVSFPELPQGHLLGFKSNPVFLNFNYTDTLEKYYYVHRNRIVYIHGKAKVSEDTIILGHGRLPEDFEIEEGQPPEGLTEEQLDEWKDWRSDQFDYSYESAKTEILSYFSDSFKSTGEIIEKRKSFFDSLNEIREIFVLGHSISRVDQPYISKVIASINGPEVKWTVSYYFDWEKESHEQKLLSLGLTSDQINLVKIETLRNELPSLF